MSHNVCFPVWFTKVCHALTFKFTRFWKKTKNSYTSPVRLPIIFTEQIFVAPQKTRKKADSAYTFYLNQLKLH